MYLNIVYFANNCNGVEAAANTYFNKDASDLTLAEAASIAGITQFPSEYDPFVHPDKNIEKRNLVLGKMRELGYITDAEYAEASGSDLVVSNAYRQNQGRITSYFVDQVVNDVIADLMTQKRLLGRFRNPTGIQRRFENLFNNGSRHSKYNGRHIYQYV